MKLFAFQPEGYGQQWFVASPDRETAIESVRQWIASQPDEWSREFYTERFNLMVNGWHGYRIEEHEINQPVHAEIS